MSHHNTNYQRRGSFNQRNKPHEKDPLLQYFEKNTLSVNENNFNEFIEKVKEYCKNSRDITTSQIRNIFHSLKKIASHLKESEDNQTTAIKEIQKLRPILAYVGGKNKNAHFQDFTETLESIASQIKNNKDVRNFYQFVESMVCYLKFYEEAKNQK